MLALVQQVFYGKDEGQYLMAKMGDIATFLHHDKTM